MWLLITSQSQKVSELRTGPGRLSPELMPHAGTSGSDTGRVDLLLVGRGMEDRRDPGT